MSKSKDQDQDALKGIEKTIKKIGSQQNEICERLEGMERRLEALAGARASTAAGADEVLGFLDQFRSGEALGEASLGAWIAVSSTDCLRGGLRTIQLREGMHARLLEQRIKELGGSATAEVPEAIFDAVMKDAGDADKSDADKVKEFVARFPDVDAAIQPILDMASKAGRAGDEETQSLLETIAQDERSTLVFLQSACAQLNP